MLVITAPNGSILSFPPLGGTTFLSLDGSRHETGTVREVAPTIVKRHATETAAKAAKLVGDAALDNEPWAFSDTADIMRDLRWIDKTLQRDSVQVGAEGITMRVSGRGVGLDIPAAAKPAAPTVEVGHIIAVGPTISPKALMNVRGEVTAIVGGKATVKIDAGDRSRLNRATGKAWGESVKLPLVCCEPVG